MQVLIMPRITISLPQDQYEAINRLSELQGRPMSKIINELIELTFPSVKRILDVIEATKHFTEEQKQSMQKALDDADRNMSTISPVIADLFEGIETAAGTKTPTV